MENRNLILIAIILLMAGIGALFYLQEEPSSEELKTKCCQECLDAFSQSPVAVGKSGAQCGNFPTGQPISKACQEYFEQHPTTVAECE